MAPLTRLDQEDIDYAERWEFIKSLPHRYIRDIAFAIASPSLLMISCELPIVNNSMLGGDTCGWNLSKSWLKTLDVQSVINWFGARKCRTRLGDHFAASVEYVLQFSPILRTKRLLVSKQLTQEIEISNGFSDRQTMLEAVNASLDVQQRSDSINVAAFPSEKVCAPEHAQNLPGNKKEKKKLSSKAASRTIGEFDFLFQLSCDKPEDPEFSAETNTFCENSGSDRLKEETRRVHSTLEQWRVSGEQVVHHWEVSVKFLLYAGPWEPLGLETPNHATWNLKRNTECEEENYYTESGKEYLPAIVLAKSSMTDSMQKTINLGSDEFMGCYLGPHAGETLLDRKSRLRNQLKLSQNPLADSFLRRAYPFRDDAQNPVKIVPTAVLKGYLFYEYELWQYLQAKRGGNSHGFCRWVGYACTSEVNPMHWMGWWARIQDFEKFAVLPEFQNSRWYIVPKKEWLSPVIVNGSTANGSSQVLELHQLLAVADAVAEEAAAASSQADRKRRFMVVEVKWDPEFAAVAECRNRVQDGTSAGLQSQGGWIEASRGFIVEETWPDSKTYRPHGYVPHWSLGLQKLTK